MSKNKDCILKQTHNTPIKRKAFFSLFFLSFLLGLTSCGQRPDGNGLPAHAINSNFIMGELDWKEVIQLPTQGKIRKNSRAVGNISIFKEAGMITRCTAFLISPDIAMTNHHCIGNASEAQDAYIEFKFEKNVSPGQRARFTCDQFLMANRQLDFALVKCQGRPGKRFGYVGIDGRKLSLTGKKIYVIHQNCNHERDPFCIPNKKYSPGIVSKVDAAPTWKVQYNADTLQGSSGGPVFLGESNKVVAINHVGLYHFGADGNMIGEANAGVPMHLILNHLRNQYPHLHSQLVISKRRALL